MSNMKFTDFPPCKSRFGCVQCRNNEKFVEHMKERFGDWECPEGIPFGTPIEKMPKHIQAKAGLHRKNLQENSNNSTSEKSTTTPENTINNQIKIFTETPGCIHRMMCVECRNNEKFRQRIEQQMGTWECPENIPIGTPLNEMPKKVQEIHKKRHEQIKIQKERMEKVRIALDGIEEVIPEKALGLVDTVRTHIFPDAKKAFLCKNNTGETKKVQQKCCGGKVKMIDGFVCSKFGDVSDRRCRACQDFESKR